MDEFNWGVFEQANREFGPEHHERMLIEEAGEVLQAWNHRRRGRGDTYVEEVCDLLMATLTVLSAYDEVDIERLMQDRQARLTRRVDAKQWEGIE